MDKSRERIYNWTQCPINIDKIQITLLFVSNQNILIQI